DDRIGGSRRTGICDLDFPLVGGLEQVGPACRGRYVLPCQQLGVEPETDRTGINPDRTALCAFILLDRPWLQLIERRRLVFDRKPRLRRGQMRISGASKPDITARILRLG